MFKYIKQLFCRHDYKWIARHGSTQQNLWQCGKCGTYYIQHYGIGIGYKCKTPNIDGCIDKSRMDWSRV